jgi:S1-C subfamily serine protease
LALAFGSPSLAAWPSLEARERPPALPRAVTPRAPLAADEVATIELFRRVSPSVVNITSLARMRDMFSWAVHEVSRGSGSGFIWDDAGHVVTNAHVIEDGSALTVTLADQSTYEAEVAGVFAERDLAVLRIEAPRERLRPIAIGASHELQVGQRVLAIGNPFGLDQTLTTGVVSALDREIESAGRHKIRGAIQTDAAINHGNSGGPLLDSAGRLIGVNTSIYSPSGASAGIGFAIPVDEVNRIVPRLIRDGRFLRPSLGADFAPEHWSQALRLPGGAAVLRVQARGPAERGGLEGFRRLGDGRVVAGDVITGVDEATVRNVDDLLIELERRQAGDEVQLTLWRQGRSRRQRLRLVPGE